MRTFGRRLPLLLLSVIVLFSQNLSPALAAWTAPVELTATEGSLLDPDMGLQSLPALAVQKDGVAHIIYLEKTGKLYSIIHQTNKTGTWQTENITSSATRLGSPAAAVYNGRLYLAWTRGVNRNSEIISATNAAGAWSSSRMTANSVPDVDPAIAVRRGKVYIAWIRATHVSPDGLVDSGAACVKTNVSGRWHTEKIGHNYYSPGTPVLKVDGRGTAHIIYSGSVKESGPSVIIHADNTSGAWRQERLPVNLDGRGKTVSAEMPALALYKNVVYVVFMRTPLDMDPDVPRIVLAVKKSGVWRLKMLTRNSGTGFSDGPRIAVSRGRVRVTYTKMDITSSGTFESEVRYLELVHGRLRVETLDSESFTMDPTAIVPPTFTIFEMVGFDGVQGIFHAAYLRLTVDLANEKVGVKLLYSRRDPD